MQFDPPHCQAQARRRGPQDQLVPRRPIRAFRERRKTDPRLAGRSTPGPSWRENNDSDAIHSRRRRQHGRAFGDVYQGARRLQAPLRGHRGHHQGQHQECCAARSREEGRGLQRRGGEDRARRAARGRLGDQVRHQCRRAPQPEARADRHAHLRAGDARAAQRALHEDRVARARSPLGGRRCRESRRATKSW